MLTIRSKVISFIILVLTVVLVLCLVMLRSPNLLEIEFWKKLDSLFIILAALLLLAFGCYPLVKMKRIELTSNRISFQNYWFTSKIKEMKFTDYDCYKIINEVSENGTYEAVWLIKDGKLEDSFSTYEYSNYEALKSNLKVTFKGELQLSPMKQLLCRFGAKI